MNKYPMLKTGNFFFPVKDIKKKFTVENTFDVILTQKDFEDFEGKWNDFWNKPEDYKSKSYTKLDLILFNFYLPKVLWVKLNTKEYKRIWKGTDWLCPNHVMMHSDKTLVVGVDCLKEVKR